MSRPKLGELSHAAKRRALNLPRKPRKLGERQRNVLRSLREHGSWFPACGWVWSTRSETIGVLDSLVRAGVVTKTGNVYRPVQRECSREGCSRVLREQTEPNAKCHLCVLVENMRAKQEGGADGDG
jgi:hypothetical protein